MRTLKDWASVAEIAASIAVVVSVFFIVVELRPNTNAIQAQTYQDLTSELNDWRRIAIDKPWLRKVNENWETATLEERQI